MTLRSVAIVGPGRMGLTLAQGLWDSGVVGSITVYGRHPDPPGHPLFAQGSAEYVYGAAPLDGRTAALILAVPETTIPEVAHAFAAQGPAPEGCAAFHLSGALPSDVLEPLYHAGYAVGTLHPLLAVTHPLTGADRLPGASLALTGGPMATRVAGALADAMGMSLIEVPAGRRALYHAAVVLASTTILPILDQCARLLVRAGVDHDQAVESLLPLVRSTLASVEERGTAESLRGPVARGDVETVSLHLRALDPEDQRLYALVGSELVRLSEGMDPDTRGELDDLFDRYTRPVLSEAGGGDG
ncbi:MAG: Rossmann-like and DUF2520 domain-containing protein [Gemmatimonadota bacterium]